ncbi:MAG: SGNH/GDSL hydrolase family protein [Candidatus Hodarchaeota archaeon]
MKGSSKKRVLVLTGLVCILVSAACNEWVLAAFFSPDGVLEGPTRAKIYVFELAFLLAGLYLVKNRSSEKVQNTVLTIGRVTIYMAFLILIMELSSFFIFRFVTPEELTERADSALGLLDKRSRNVSWCMPNLWSNYSPHPLSPKCSIYGWRYGGGPKKHKIRILCLGGSTTWSYCVDFGELSYPARLEAYLHEKGYDVDVINGGVPYYSSAEVLASLCFRGVYTCPDVVLIHTGLNDMEPLMSPCPYRADYSHWRIPGAFCRDALFAEIWERIPSWTVRLLSMICLKPGTGSRLGKQVTNIWDAILARNNIVDRYPLGLETNLRSMIALAKSIGIEPVVILFKNNVDHPKGYWGRIEDPKVRNLAKERAKYAMDVNNRVMASVARETDVPIIRFDLFEASDNSVWIDHCHLNAEGCIEKAKFIGNRLIAKGILSGLLEDKSDE